MCVYTNVCVCVYNIEIKIYYGRYHSCHFQAWQPSEHVVTDLLRNVKSVQIYVIITLPIITLYVN